VIHSEIIGAGDTKQQIRYQALSFGLVERVRES
jgi:hypothetical protein